MRQSLICQVPGIAHRLQSVLFPSSVSFEIKLMWETLLTTDENNWPCDMKDDVETSSLGVINEFNSA